MNEVRRNPQVSICAFPKLLRGRGLQFKEHSVDLECNLEMFQCKFCYLFRKNFSFKHTVIVLFSFSRELDNKLRIEN